MGRHCRAACRVEQPAAGTLLSSMPPSTCPFSAHREEVLIDGAIHEPDLVAIGNNSVVAEGASVSAAFVVPAGVLGRGAWKGWVRAQGGSSRVMPMCVLWVVWCGEV